MKISSEPRSTDSFRVLVVDDHSINREFLRSALALESFDVEEASSGPEAVDRCRQVEYDLILMDLHMPGQDGIETATAIQALGTGSAGATVVFLTADTREQVHAQLREAGFIRVLNKPVNVDTLIRRLKDWQILDTNRPDPLYGSESRLLIDEAAGLASCNGQPELLARMKQMFAEEMDRRLGDLEQRVKTGDRSGAEAILHQWTGAVAYAGAGRLARRIQSLRTALCDQGAANNKHASLADAYLTFLRCARATRAALRHEASSQS